LLSKGLFRKLECVVGAYICIYESVWENRLRVEGASIPPGLTGTTYMDTNAWGSIRAYVPYHIYTCTRAIP